MSEDDVEHNREEPRKLDKAKEVIKNNWKPFTVGVVLTVATVIVVKRVFPNQTALLIKKLVIKDNVFLIQSYARQQGPPSYLVECLETGEKWISQTDTAKALGISKSLLSSRFINGIAQVDGKHYLRRAMVIPNSG